MSEFKKILQSLNVDKVSVFATASLRNIDNTQEVVEVLHNTTGFNIEVIDENEEALLSFYGARLELPEISEGAFTDIGGASTEIISFTQNEPSHIVSFRLGSLNLYKNCVKDILPGKKSLKNISSTIEKQIKENTGFTFTRNDHLICVGGTARAVMKIARKIYHLPENANTLTRKQLEELFTLLTGERKTASRLILRMAPDRIHTIIPGLCILMHITHLYHSEKIIVSTYGIREGFLCRKII